MNKEEFIKEVSNSLNCEIESLNLTTQQGEISSWDSMGHVNLLMHLSQSFGKTIDPNQIADLTSLQQIYDYFTKTDA